MTVDEAKDFREMMWNDVSYFEMGATRVSSFFIRGI